MREKYSTCVFCGWNPSLDLWYLSLAIVMMITLHKTFHSTILNCAFKKFFDIFIYNQTWAHNQLVNVCAWAVLWAKKRRKTKTKKYILDLCVCWCNHWADARSIFELEKLFCTAKNKVRHFTTDSCGNELR